MSIYSRHQQFRVPGSSKAENYRALHLPTREYLLKTRIVDRRGKPDYTAEELGLKITHKLNFSHPKHNSVPLRHKTDNHHSSTSFSRVDYGLRNDEIITLIVKMLRSHGDSTTRVIVDREGRFVGRNGVSGRICLISGEHNASDNCFFRISGGVVHYHCFDNIAHEYCASKVIGVLNEAPIYQRAHRKN